MKARIVRMQQPAFANHFAAVADCAAATEGALKAVRPAKPPAGLGPFAEIGGRYHRHHIKALELRLQTLAAARVGGRETSMQNSARYEQLSDAAMDQYAAMGRITFDLAAKLGRDPWDLSKPAKPPE